jgi:hypothetical protein
MSGLFSGEATLFNNKQHGGYCVAALDPLQVIGTGAWIPAWSFLRHGL